MLVKGILLLDPDYSLLRPFPATAQEQLRLEYLSSKETAAAAKRLNLRFTLELKGQNSAYYLETKDSTDRAGVHLHFWRLSCGTILHCNIPYSLSTELVQILVAFGIKGTFY